MKFKKLLFLFLLAFPAFGALTTIQDTLNTATGGKCSGSLSLRWPTFTSVSGQLIQGGTTTVPITNGAINFSVEPGSYQVTYLISTGCSQVRENWLVPVSGSPVNLAQVRTLNPPAPPTLIPLQFLSQSGAAIGQVPLWNGAQWVPGAGGGGGGGGDVFGPGASANGELSVFNGTTGKAIKPSGLTAGLIKVNALAVPSVAVAGTDYAAPPPGTSPLKGNGAGGFSTVVSADIISMFSGCSGVLTLTADGSCHAAGTGDVIGPSISTNGELTVFSGTTGKTVKVSGLGAGIVKLSSSAVPSIAAAGTDYAPAPSGASPLKGNGAGGFSSALAADIIGLFSGCSGSLNLGADGFCHAGTGDVVGPGASSNGELTVFSGTTGKAVKASGLTAGLIKVNSLAVPSVAVSGTDYAPATSGSLPLKGNGSGGFSSAAATDFINLFSGCSGTLYLGADSACHATGTGDVTGPGASTNGELTVFNGTSGKIVKVSGLGAGIVKLSASAVPSIATSGTDYAPATSGSVPLKGNGSGGFSSSVAADTIGLFSGCSGVLYLGADGACHVDAGGSVFTGSTATAPSFSTTPTFSLADISVKSPKCFEPGAATANITSVTFTNKTAGAEFCIAWLQDGTGGRTVTYGASASNTCQISATASKTTTQYFRVKADGSTVVGTYCTSDDNLDTPLTGPASSTAHDVMSFADTSGKVAEDAGFLATNIVRKDAANTAGSAMTLDMSGSTATSAFRMVNKAGAAPTVAGVPEYDTTNKNVHIGANSVDNVVGMFPAASLPTDGNCVKASVSSSVVRLADAGAACGSGAGGGTVVPKTGNYTLLSTDGGKIFTFNSSSLTATLVATAPTMPWIVGIKNLHSTDLTISRNGNTINGGTSDITLKQYQEVTCESDTVTANNYVCTTPMLGSSTITLTPSAAGQAFSIPSSVALAGSPTTTTQSANDNSTKVATTAYADTGLALKANTSVTLTGGAGIAAIGDLSTNRTIATASGEADFLASGALTCGAATQGKMQVHTTPLQYCDNAATPALQYAAYGTSAGLATAGDSATAFFTTGQIEAARGGTGGDSSAATGFAKVASGTWSYAALGASDIPVAASVFNSGTITIPAGNAVIVGCTSTCTVPVPVPVAGYQICVKNNAGVSTVITLSALGSSAMYPKADDSGYGTAGTGTMVSSAAAGNKVCLIGRDSTHYELGAVNASANWTVN